MMTAADIASILGSIAWPLTVILLVLKFKSDISGLLKRIEKAKLPGGAEASFAYGEAPIDKVPIEPSPGPKAVSVAQPEQAKKNTIKWRSSGNLFWLGHDLTWTIDTLLRGGPRDHIVHGLRQSLHHLRSLGLVDTPVEARLARLKAEAQNSLEKDWTPPRRSEYTNELASLIRAIGDLAEANQPDFQPGPKE